MNTQQMPDDAAYEAQALKEEIAAITEDIQSLIALRETFEKRLEQLAGGRDVSPVTLRLVPGKAAEPSSSEELPPNDELLGTGVCG
jgi:prefoldin subunit 5